MQSDVTQNKQFEAGLLHRATHDPLTGLPNTALLEERLAAALQDADRNGSLVAVALIDIDIACDELQGFYFSRPTSADLIEDLLRSAHTPA